MAQPDSCQPLIAEARFKPGSVHVGFVVDQVMLGQVFLQVLQFSPVSILTPWLSILVYHLGDEQ
jgi:hypothetical protein